MPAVTADAWFVEVDVDEADVDLASGMAWAAGAVGVEERAAGAATAVRLVVAVGPEGADPLLAALARWSPRTTVVPGDVVDADLDAWRAHARPWRAGRRLVVEPPWHPLADDERRADDLVLRIDPGRTFGSGSHPSTRLALALLEDALDGPAGGGHPGRVLDVGCGSGVLAVAAARLGAVHVLALDVDGEALDATTTNAAANGVGDRTTTSSATVAEAVATEAPFDVVVANILAAVLIDLGPDLVAATAPGGTLLLAGLLDDQEATVAAAVDRLRLVRSLHDDGWAALELRRPG